MKKHEETSEDVTHNILNNIKHFTVGKDSTLKAENEVLCGEMPKLWKEATSSKSCLAPGSIWQGDLSYIYIYV